MRFGQIRYFPYPWTASVWNRMDGLYCFTMRAASCTGWTVPSSLFTYIMETRIVSVQRASFSASSRILPYSSTGR